MTTIELGTIRSTLAQGKFVAEPYDRVIQAVINGGQYRLPRPRTIFQAEKVRTIQASEEFAARLGSFIVDYFIQPGALQQQQNLRPRVRNCFAFAMHMAGIQFKDYADARRKSNDIPISDKPDYTPAAGSIGMIAHPGYGKSIETKAGEPQNYSPYSHAYVCLAEGDSAETTECIQVPACGGPIGLTTLAEIVLTHQKEIPGIAPWFQHGRAPSKEDIQPYTLQLDRAG